MTDLHPEERGVLTEAVLTGAGAVTAYGRGSPAMMAGLLSGRPAFGPVDRFDVSARRAKAAALNPDARTLAVELADTVGQACDQARLSAGEVSRMPLFLAFHGDPLGLGAEGYAQKLAAECGLASGGTRAYTAACVSASSAVADAAALIVRGRAERVLVAAGYLVESDQFALFDAGRALADDGAVRPFSAGRRGLLLGDGVAAAVVESAGAARARRAPILARIAGWGRCGDAYHPVRPRPDGSALARAIAAALRRAGISAHDLGYVNPNGGGSKFGDSAEAAALHAALGDAAATLPVSSTKSLHGQALEAAGLVELLAVAGALRAGRLPVNAGYLGPDEECRLNLILDESPAVAAPYALSLNVAFGGANTALVVGAP